MGARRRMKEGVEKRAKPMKIKTKAAVYVGTRNVYAEILPSLKSLLINSDVDKVYLLIEDDEYPYEVPDCVEPINVSGQTYFRKDGPNYYTIKWTWMTMMRAALAYVLPEDLDIVLSLDNDTIISKNISDIWELPIDDYYFAASREPKKSKGGAWEICDMYAQMGVVLQNLKKLRDGKTDEVINMLNTRRLIFADQDALVLSCQGHIYPMPSRYNVNEFTEPTDDVAIRHYAADSKWMQRQPVIQYGKISWDEVMELHNEKKGRREVD